MQGERHKDAVQGPPDKSCRFKSTLKRYHVHGPKKANAPSAIIWKTMISWTPPHQNQGSTINIASC